ncbi:MAG: hypothetical protein DWQ19_09135 [Crenarchaeota archaeon]|nr:MAG: hypothetical protein DWQ19_09135 [Thermoproteota archaeon]
MPKYGRITTIETIVFLAIISIFSLAVVGGCSTTFHRDAFKAQVVRKYEVNQVGENGSYTVYRIDVQRNGSDFIETLENRDDFLHGKWNSATIHANLLEGKWYVFDTAGSRAEWLSWFPNVLEAKLVPKDVEAELDY